jgi:antitoxin component YwqK of YwqJK toxin-antitoxin module
MFEFNGFNDAVGIKAGTSGRGFYQPINNGRTTISGTDHNGKQFQTVVLFQNGKVVDRKEKQNGKTFYHIVYGKYEKTPSGITRFKGDGKSKHGKARFDCSLFDHPGVCHSWYANGKLIRQKFVYANRVAAYEYRWSARSQTMLVKNPDKSIRYELAGVLNGRGNLYRGSYPILDENHMELWFLHSEPFEVKQNEKIIFKGQYENQQKIGEWIQDGLTSYFRNGVEIPQKLYDTPIDQLNLKQILKIKNAQVRMALMSAVPVEKIASIGKEIHQDGDMRLYDIPGFDVRILRVKCTTTKAFYYLKVPKDAKHCEPARQWTFGVGDWLREPIKFAKET